MSKSICTIYKLKYYETSMIKKTQAAMRIFWFKINQLKDKNF